MNIYTRKQQWKIALLLAAVAIGMSSLWYTNQLVDKLADEERKKISIWAQAYQELNTANDNITFVAEIIKNNTSIPVIFLDKNEHINGARNLDSTMMEDTTYLREQLAIMKSQHEGIVIKDEEGNIQNYIYYKDSVLLTQLKYYPVFQLGVIALFILVSYFAFSSSRRAEQNQVWVGMAKETAHQLGTPLSSLIGWLELLKMKGVDEETTNEIGKDIKRLETITERFSKIGSAPKLGKENIVQVLTDSANYMRSRAPKKVELNVHTLSGEYVPAPVNVPLFAWVIENLCNNAIDAMDGQGKIDITISDETQFIYIDVADTGKGIAKSKYKRVFQPGYTTKEKGWGLGLSLTKRIVEIYHAGKVFVKKSELGKGTTFRIVLNKNI